MKQIIRYISVVVLLMFSTTAFARGGVKVEIASLQNGTITSSLEGQTCTLTVTPAAGYYIRKGDITVQKTVDPSAAKTRGDINVTDKLTLNGDEPNVLSATRTYTFDIPEGYNAYVTASFTACSSINLSVSMSGWTYGDEDTTPSVAGNTGNATVSYSYAASGSTDFTASKPVNAGEYTVKATVPAIGIYTAAEATASFTIARRSVNVTAENKTKTFGADDPELTATVEGTIGDNKVTYTLTRAEGEAVGEYAITASGDAEQGNYSVSYTGAKFTITPSPVIDESQNETIDGETFYEPNEETKEAMHDHFDTEMEMTADAANHMHMNENHEMEFSEGKDVDVLLKGELKSDIITIYFTGHIYVHAGVLRQKNAATTRSTRSDDDMELESGVEYEVQEDGDIVLILATHDGEVILKEITNTHANNNTTGIEKVKGEEVKSEKWYDINGRLLQSKPTKTGLYIHNGQKVVIK